MGSTAADSKGAKGEAKSDSAQRGFGKEAEGSDESSSGPSTAVRSPPLLAALQPR